MSSLARHAHVDADIDPRTHQRIARMMAHYGSAIDSLDLDRWPEFFTEDGVYRILTRADHDAGRDFGIWYCSSRAMLLDRVKSIQSVNVFEPHVYRHVIGASEVVDVDGDTYACETSYLIVRTGYEGGMVLFSAGRYLDRIVIEGERALLRERVVVTDSRRYDTLVALPL